MLVRSIHIARDGDWGGGRIDPTKPLRAVVQVEGQHGKVELNLSDDMSKRVIDLIADEIVAAGRKTAEAMTADILNTQALPAPEAA